MRTTIELPTPLAKRAKIAAVRRGVTLKALIAQAIEHELDANVPPKLNQGGAELPVIPSATPGAYEIEPERLAQVLLREEIAAYEAAQRR